MNKNSFTANKYTTWYFNIVDNAKNRVIVDEYCESHHIVPKCLGGDNSETNLVKLTPKEHFICHLLLTKMTTGKALNKLKFALHMMANVKNIGEGRHTPSSRLYAYSKKCFMDALTEVWTEEKRRSHGEKIRKIVTGRKHKASSIEKMKDKVWSKKALNNRLENCLKSAEKRRGSNWSDKQRASILKTYVNKNLDIALKIIELHDKGMNKRQISLALGITWDKVKYSLLHRDAFEGELKLHVN